jgi:hypothetical protein
MGGLVGRLFREFGDTAAIAILISGLVSLTLTPVLCSLFLTRHVANDRNRFLLWCDAWIERMRQAYARSLAKVLRHQRLTLGVMLTTLAVTLAMYTLIPKGFFPQQDNGLIGGVTEASPDISYPDMLRQMRALAEMVRQDEDIQNVYFWIEGDPSINVGGRPNAVAGMLMDVRYRAGVARLAERDLVYDAWQYYPQLPELCDLADSFPTLPVVVNHCGGLLGIGAYADSGNFDCWRRHIVEIARRPNVAMKLGGLARHRCGFNFESRAVPPAAGELCATWKPYIETCIEAFGPSRCMFESNFPPDNVAGGYDVIWNAFKLIASGCSASEKTALFSATAGRIYGIR